MVNLRDDEGFARLATEIAEKTRGEEFDFYWSPGNWGDSLINHGTLAHFQHHHFTFRNLTRNDLPRTSNRAKVAVVSGGGGWSNAWSSTPRFVADVAKTYDDVILLPTSFDLKIADLDLPNVTYFSRDTSIDPGRAIYCPDMAFFLQFEESAAPSLNYPLICLREDRERHPKSFSVPKSHDLSLLGEAYDPINPLIDIVSKFEKIYTDRLHIAITGGMLGREVFLLDGNYPKARRVYTASMLEMRNVRLITWTQFRKIPDIRSRIRADIARRTRTEWALRVARRLRQHLR